VKGNKRKRRVHPKLRAKLHVFSGEDDAVPLCDWLNQTNRPAGDPVEKFINLYNQIGVRDPRDLQTFVHRLTDHGFAVAPSLNFTGTEFKLSWDPVWPRSLKLTPDQGLALIKALRLAEKGLLSRVRQCAWQKCSQWYFARFEHHVCCSTKCQQRYARSTPEWKERRKLWMRDHRKTLKERKRRQLTKELARKWTQKDDERLGKRHSRFAADMKKKRWHG
jgi:hypothetical protein